MEPFEIIRSCRDMRRYDNVVKYIDDKYINSVQNGTESVGCCKYATRDFLNSLEYYLFVPIHVNKLLPNVENVFFVSSGEKIRESNS